MNIQSIINESIPSLALDDNVEKALDLSNDLAMNALPLVSNQEFKGLVTVDMLLNQNQDAILADIEPFLSKKSIFGHDHFFSAINFMAENRSTIAPIVDEQGLFLGVVSNQDLLQYMGGLTLFTNEGGILIISMPAYQYSLNELSRLAESNDAQIVASFVTASEVDPNDVYVTLKFNKTDLTRLIATYERFSFNIVATYHQSNVADFEMERLQQLFRYMNI